MDIKTYKEEKKKPSLNHDIIKVQIILYGPSTSKSIKHSLWVAYTLFTGSMRLCIKKENIKLVKEQCSMTNISDI